MTELIVNEELIKRLADECRYNSHPLSNFVLSHVDTMACFISAPERYHSYFLILDTNFTPLMGQEVSAYIHTCGISDDGNYAIYQTANSPDRDAAESFFFFDTRKKSVVWNRKVEHDWVGITQYVFNTSKLYWEEWHSNEHLKYRYDFEWNMLYSKRDSDHDNSLDSI